jgi:hypothetical protein
MMLAKDRKVYLADLAAKLRKLPRRERETQWARVRRVVERAGGPGLRATVGGVGELEFAAWWDAVLDWLDHAPLAAANELERIYEAVSQRVEQVARKVQSALSVPVLVVLVGVVAVLGIQASRR